MGKWTYLSSGDMVSKVSAKKQELAALTPPELLARWEAAGAPTLNDYGLQWYAGSSGDGWATIDDSASRKQFMLSCPREAYHDTGTGILRCRWEMIASIAAHEYGLTKLAVVSEVAAAVHASVMYSAMSEATLADAKPAEEFMVGDVFMFTWLNFEGPYRKMFIVKKAFNIQTKAVSMLEVCNLGDEKKTAFINVFLRRLEQTGFIGEVPLIRTFEFQSEVELDRVSKEWLTSKLFA